MVNLFNSGFSRGQIRDSLDETIRRIRAKYQEIEKRFSGVSILENSKLYEEVSHSFVYRISKDLIKSPEGKYVSPEIVVDERNFIENEGVLLGYDIESKKFVIASRKNFHKNPRIMHYGVYCFIHTFDRKYTLFQKRGETDLYPGKWTCPVSGHVDLGESFLEALAREYKEELRGTSVRYLRNVRKKGDIKIRNKNEWEMKRIYDVEVEPSDLHFNLDSEIHGFCFFRTDKLHEMIDKNYEDFTEGVIKAYKEFF